MLSVFPFNCGYRVSNRNKEKTTISVCENGQQNMEYLKAEKAPLRLTNIWKGIVYKILSVVGNKIKYSNATFCAGSRLSFLKSLE